MPKEAKCFSIAALHVWSRVLFIFDSLSPNSSADGRSSLAQRFSMTDESLRNITAIFAFKADSWNSIFGGKANFMEHLSLLG